MIFMVPVTIREHDGNIRPVYSGSPWSKGEMTDAFFSAVDACPHWDDELPDCNDYTYMSVWWSNP